MSTMKTVASPNPKRTVARPSVWASLLTLALVPALLAAGCGWGGGGSRQAAQAAQPAPPAAQPPAARPAPPPVEEPPAVPYQRPEIVERVSQPQPEREIVDPEPRAREVAPPSPAATAKVESLAERERRLREREADLAAREAAVTARESEVVEREVEAPAPEPAAEAAPAEAEQVAEAPPPPPPPPPKIEVRLATGTAVDVEFLKTLSSATARAGDTFRTRVSGDVYDDRGNLAIPVGAEVVGVVTEAVPLPKVGGRARLGLKFTDVVLPGGETAKISASLIEQGRSETGRDAATIGGATAGGAILGRILDRGKKKRGAVLGAIIGAAAGAAIASKSEGEEVEIPAGSVVGVQLDRDLEMRVPERR
jgi:hypothetical protein